MPRQKLIRFADLHNLSNVALEQEVDDFVAKGGWQNIFGDSHPIILELGCGRGEYSNYLAKLNPDKNYVGVDLKGERIWQAATNGANTPNLFFIRSQVQFISKFFHNQKVAEIWITFADPQPFKPKKRLTSQYFLNQYLQILKPDGIIHLKTDSDILYESTLEVLDLFSKEGYKVTILANTNDLYNSDLYQNELKIQTKFEQIFVERGHTIKYLKFRLGKIDF
jgi:tRNA (guanine-N7-)-methyltransferase